MKILVTSIFLFFFLLLSPVFSSTDFTCFKHSNQTFESNKETKKTKLIKASLSEINKHFVKSIKSPDGDIIDCVLIHRQPAFNNLMLKATMTLEPPNIPNEYFERPTEPEFKQLWSSNGESCPEGTIPIIRTTESEILRVNSISRARKNTSNVDSLKDSHEHAIGYIEGGEYYGAQATLNVWAPNVTGHGEFSITQIWVVYDVPNHELNAIEVGWQVSPTMYGTNLPRLFIYWTNDGYRSGCYNLLCSGFIQTNNKVLLGGAIAPISTYNGRQYEFTILIWKDPMHGNWWLHVGKNLVGYWPSTLFPDFRDHATMIQYGGEVINAKFEGQHTSTQMGSGHFPTEGFRKASYVRNVQTVDINNKLNPVSGVSLLVEKSSCYDAKKGFDRVLGNYIFFGGPGKNPNCP